MRPQQDRGRVGRDTGRVYDVNSRNLSSYFVTLGKERSFRHLLEPGRMSVSARKATIGHESFRQEFQDERSFKLRRPTLPKPGIFSCHSSGTWAVWDHQDTATSHLALGTAIYRDQYGRARDQPINPSVLGEPKCCRQAAFCRPPTQMLVCTRCSSIEIYI